MKQKKYPKKSLAGKFFAGIKKRDKKVESYDGFIAKVFNRKKK